MSAHYTYFEHIFPSVDASGDLLPDQALEIAQSSQKMLFALIVAFGMIVLGKMLTSRLKTPEGIEGSIIPPRRGSMIRSTFSFVDLCIESFILYHDSVLGKENRKYIPLVAGIFFFILILNLLGLIPGVPAATTTVWVNVAMALVVFIYFNYLGLKEHGFAGYLKHFAGPVLAIAPVFFCLEIMSTFMRILTLNLRLYWNITADHIVLDTFVNLLENPYVPFLATPFYGLGVFVSFMQAFVFATLTMIYILLATQHEEEH